LICGVVVMEFDGKRGKKEEGKERRRRI
jgi:hypothetical protein